MNETEQILTVRRTVARAVDKAFDEWAAEHPSLATVIDRAELRTQTVERLRDSEQYAAAVLAYHRARSELALLGRLVDLARPVLAGLLGG